MAKLKNISGDDRTLNGRLVLAGQVVEVPDEDVESHICQETIWAKAPAAKKETK